jgi:hypothetical protein
LKYHYKVDQQTQKYKFFRALIKRLIKHNDFCFLLHYYESGLLFLLLSQLMVFIYFCRAILTNYNDQFVVLPILTHVKKEI